MWQVETTDLTELNIIRVHEGDKVAISFDAIQTWSCQGRLRESRAMARIARVILFTQSSSGWIR